VLLTFMLAPVIGWLERRRLPRLPAVFAVLLVSVGSILAVSWVVSNQLLDVINQLPSYKENIQQKLDVIHGRQNGILTKTAATVEELSKELNTAPPHQLNPLPRDPAQTSKTAASPRPRRIPSPSK
jgi:predicted PurR-regulated permease PerM